MTDASRQEPARLPHILLVEDSPSDRLMTTMALKDSGIPHVLSTVVHGMDALRFLRQEDQFAGAPRPDLILLDLNLPRMDGRDLLTRIKIDPGLRTIPVVVLSTSNAPSDLRVAYGQHTNCYLRKPSEFDAFVDRMRITLQFWFEHVEPAPLPITAVSVSDAAEALSRPRVLLVEDSPSDARLIREALAADDDLTFEITHVDRIANALNRLRAEQFDVIISDLSLPDAQGTDTIRLLASVGSGTPIIALTRSYSEVGESMLSAGADDFLPKDDVNGKRLARLFRHAVRRRRLQQDELQAQRIQLVGRLSASVAHDMNNLLTAIRLAAESLLPLDEERADVVQEVLAHVQRGASLTRQLLSFGRRSADEPRPLEVNAAVSAAAAWVSRLLKPSVRLDVGLTDASTTVMGDQHQIEQLVMNLMLNANDAMPDGGRLSLRTEVIEIGPIGDGGNLDAMKGRSCVQITVADSGVGIPSTLMPMLFEPFFTTKPEHQGTGLGLASVREVVRRHHGTVNVRNIETGGAEFTVVLPRIEVSLQQAPIRRTPLAGMKAIGEAGESTPPSILLAEDEEPIAKAMTRILRNAGYRVQHVPSADAAWDVWSAAPADFDLLLTDLMMPGTLSVVDLVRRITRTHAKFPVIYCSGYPGNLDEALELEEGENFIPKPFETARLLTMIRRKLAAATAFGGPTSADS